MFTLSDIKDNLLFTKTAQALTPSEEEHDFIGSVCVVYDELMKLAKVQVNMLNFTGYPPCIHPMIEDCLELVLNTILLLSAHNSPHVICRPALRTIAEQRLRRRK